MRAAIYARYSTENQNEKSTEDQIALCRTYAKHQGYTVAATFQDKAKSGASMHNREGLLEMVALAMAGEFEVIIVEALDRLSRDMEDMSSIFKRLKFLGVKLEEVHGGEANTLTVGMKAIFAQMFREDTVHKVRRGLNAVVDSGRIAGGKAYGYTPNPLKKGEFDINPEEAEIVRRIFREYAEGLSPRRIAYGLNADNVPAPRGKQWNSSTLNGNPKRITGILHNPLYKGEIVWNKQSYHKDPDTGNRIPRLNPREEWKHKPIPHLRIVDDELWDRVQALKAKLAQPHVSHTRRPKRLLSGVVRCGACGKPMVAGGRDTVGGIRYRCSGFAESGSCPAPTTFYIKHVEALVMDTIQGELLNPAGLQIFVDEYIKVRRDLYRTRVARRGVLEKKLAVASREFERVLDGIQKGVVEAEDVKPRLDALRAEKKSLQEKIALEPDEVKEVALHPRALQGFNRQLIVLRKHMEEETLEQVAEVAQFFRQVVRDVVVWRAKDTAKLKLKISGQLNGLVDFVTGEPEFVDKDGCGGAMPSKTTTEANVTSAVDKDGCGRVNWSQSTKSSFVDKDGCGDRIWSMSTLVLPPINFHVTAAAA